MVLLHPPLVHDYLSAVAGVVGVLIIELHVRIPSHWGRSDGLYLLQLNIVTIELVASLRLAFFKRILCVISISFGRIMFGVALIRR